MRQREMCAPADSCANGESLRSSVHPAASRLRTELVCEFAPVRIQAQALCRREVRWGRALIDSRVKSRFPYWESDFKMRKAAFTNTHDAGVLILYWGEFPVACGEGLKLIH